MRVIELGQIMAAPTAGLMLADMGADVVKVEKIPGGDDSRSYREPRIGDVSAPFLMLNRNKRGVALDLKHPAGRDALMRLLEQADVLVENYRPGALARIGLDWDTLHSRLPGLIYCTVTGYGLQGPMAGAGGFDLIAQGFAGLMSITGEPDRPPAKPGNSVADINAGLLAATGVIGAYVHKLRTGAGQRVDTSLMEAALQQTAWHAAVFFATGRSPGPLGSGHVITAPYQAFRARDGWINVGGANQANWTRICDVLGQPQWKTDPRFHDNTERMAHLPALIEAMETVLVTRSRDEWIAAFEAAGVPAGPVHSIGEALSHPQVLAREMVVHTEHPRIGNTPALGVPIKFSATPGAITRHAPSLGEHTREVLAEHGLTAAEIDALLASGAALQAD